VFEWPSYQLNNQLECAAPSIVGGCMANQAYCYQAQILVSLHDANNTTTLIAKYQNMLYLICLTIHDDRNDIYKICEENKYDDVNMAIF